MKPKIIRSAGTRRIYGKAVPALIGIFLVCETGVTASLTPRFACAADTVISDPAPSPVSKINSSSTSAPEIAEGSKVNHPSGWRKNPEASQLQSGGVLARNTAVQTNQTGPSPLGTRVGGTPGSAIKQISPSNSKYADIDNLLPRTAINIPETTNTTFGDMWGLKEFLARNGFAFGGLFSGGYDQPLLNLPRRTFGAQHYIGQQSEFDTSTSYAYVTFDMGRILGRLGLRGGQADVWGCAGAGSYHIYPRGIRLCAAYIDQPFFGDKLDFKVGIINEQYFGVAPLVGGGVANGSIGPAASIITESGEAAAGEGAPAVNIRYNATRALYVQTIFQRSASPGGYVPEGEVVNPTGTRIWEPAGTYIFNGKRVTYPTSGIVFLEQAGYEHPATANSKFTWFRVGGAYNESHYTPFMGQGYRHGSAFWALFDKQLFKLYPGRPNNGIYIGASYNWGDPRVYQYSHYYELRAYVKGPFPGRPFDQLALVLNQTGASKDYLRSISGVADYQAKNGGGIRKNINSITLAYGYHIRPGMYANFGLQYSPNPTITYNYAQGSPLVFRLVLSAYY
ncbi:hypothetical protein GOB93_19040 [Acetobacter musti]|uniref:Porin n=1 Tax=Acetobacter musti TaxID=864732 RepID=A0ABX0JXE5_9PROT|nr:carbohydrate porin [Acetobacter musti]NHN86703.1 hypothetical protein [Acetobacter musti]